MTTSGRISPEQLKDFLEGLPELLENLRAQGYSVGTRQHIAAHELIGSLVARRRLPATLLELREWLAPLLCFTPAQQEDFRDQYLHWLRNRRLVDDDDLPPPPPPAELPPPERPAKQTPTHLKRAGERLKASRWLLSVLAATLVLAALFFIYAAVSNFWQEEDLTQVVVIRPPVPPPTPVPPPSVETTTTTQVVTTTTQEASTGQAWDVDKPVGGKAEVTDLSQIEWVGPPPPPGFWVRNFNALVALTLVPPFVGLGLWRLLRRWRRRREAERWRDEKPRYDKIKVRDARERVFQSAALRPIARGLRRYRSVESRQLDARSTVLASVGRGGLFTPVYGKRRTLPEYLVLIDRVGFGDQLAQFNSDLVARLSENDVYLDTYYFHGDPRRCREGGADSPQLSLSDLAARHPDHFLLIFSDGTGLMSTATGQHEPFVEQFLFWRGRALLTPIPRLEWDYREWALAREGLNVLPAGLDGLRALVEAVNTDVQAARVPGFDATPPYPDILRQQPALWNAREQPPPHQTRRLLTHLRRYLGPDGYELLCACAVYPVMQWGVTLFLAYELLGRRQIDEALPRLLRLPWFRNGTMPPWLRRTLVRELPRARRRLVRERLEHLLLAFLEDPRRGLQPRFAEGPRAPADAVQSSWRARLGEWLAAWGRRRRLRRRLESAPARSPLAEPVFVNFITNNRRAQALPEPLRHNLFRRGVSAFGLRLAPALALVSAAALTALFVLLLARPTDNIYTPGAPPDLASLLFPRLPQRTSDPDFVYTPATIRRGETVDFLLRAFLPGAYDLSNMRLVLPDASGIFRPPASLKGGDGNRLRENLPDRFAARVNAPLGPTELLLYDGERLRASLPFTITAAATPVPTPMMRQEISVVTPVISACPSVRIVASFQGAASGRSNVTTLTADVSDAPLESDQYTYTWGMTGSAQIVSGQGTRSIQVVYMNGAQPVPAGTFVSVEVGGGEWYESCSRVGQYTFPGQRPMLSLTVEPQSITVCPSDPKLNNPPDSRVTVTVSPSSPGDTLPLDAAKVTGGGIVLSSSDSNGRRFFIWNLRGVSPGTYTVTVSPYTTPQPAQRPPIATGKVTVVGCPAGSGRVSVTLVNESGEPLGDKARSEGFRIRLVDVGGDGQGSTAGRFTDCTPSRDGGCFFDNLREGRYQAEAWRWQSIGPNGYSVTVPGELFVLRPGETKNIKIRVKNTERETISAPTPL